MLRYADQDGFAERHAIPPPVVVHESSYRDHMPRVEFDRQPHLVGERFELRPLQPDDWDALFAVASDPLIWEVHPARDRYTEPVFRQFFREALESGGALVALDRATGQIIGSSRYNWFGPDRDELEIGWSFLARA